MKGFVTDIQRFSLNDGPGIRTTVFLKGCNMHCTWCHNPETISIKNNLLFYENKCIHCGKCFDACPNDAHKLADGNHIIERTLCTNCGKCASVCYAEALTMASKELSVEECMREIKQDKTYYDNSKGGLTISGGEVLMQKDFAIELSKASHKEGIQVAIESNMSFPFDEIKDLIEEVDLVMMDIKIFDDQNHKKYTGISNKNVIDNLHMLNSINKPVIVRTPLIPGVTDTIDNLKNIACLMENMDNVIAYEILNFNPLGESKYKGLDQKNDFENARPFKDEYLNNILDQLKDINVNIKIGG